MSRMLTSFGFTTAVDFGSDLVNTVALRARSEGEILGDDSSPSARRRDLSTGLAQPGAEPQPAASAPPSAIDGWEQKLGAQLTLETGLAADPQRRRAAEAVALGRVVRVRRRKPDPAQQAPHPLELLADVTSDAIYSATAHEPPLDELLEDDGVASRSRSDSRATFGTRMAGGYHGHATGPRPQPGQGLVRAHADLRHETDALRIGTRPGQLIRLPPLRPEEEERERGRRAPNL